MQANENKLLFFFLLHFVTHLKFVAYFFFIKFLQTSLEFKVLNGGGEKSTKIFLLPGLLDCGIWGS